ncbi:aromatic amino acid lyase [Vulcanisaeta distributa]|uniref:aromatic amino acid lyase n=1 Tax=Vulcanisaeta distributa TaxID=164451 RepID=UPI001FB2C931|nr:aromatic amino acid lyase [Vulcanisaeta distributa]
MPSTEALKLAGLDELKLSYKEALSLINGTSYSTAVASLGIWDSYRLLRAAVAVMALMIEASRASTAPLSTEANSTKLHRGGELEVARAISELVIDSKNVNTSGRTQDHTRLGVYPRYWARYLTRLVGHYVTY